MPEKIICRNESCYTKFYPRSVLEPGLCEDCSKIVVEAKIALLNDLRPFLNSDVYWQRLRVEATKLKVLED